MVGDLDADGHPEIVFAEYRIAQPGLLVALRGADCSTIFSRPFDVGAGTQVALADLDGDRSSEIVALEYSIRGEIRPTVLDKGGLVVARSPISFFRDPMAIDTADGASIADLDQDGIAEIVVAGLMLRYRPVQRDLIVGWTQSVKPAMMGELPVVADLDGDTFPEVIVGGNVIDGRTGVDITPAEWASVTQGGYAAVADFTGDKRPEVVMASRGNKRGSMFIYDYARRRFVMGPIEAPDQATGPPTVADYDGDGEPEVAIASRDFFTVYDLECTKNPRPAKCNALAGLGILWRKRTQDKTSFSSGSAAFDLNGDGAVDAIYRDECWLRIFAGPDGRTVAIIPMSSSTGTETPVVADVDGDQRADIVVAANDDGFKHAGQFCPDADAETGTRWTGTTRGVYVFHDPWERWRPARPLWNQHSYHVTNVNDDLTVPKVEKPSWTAHNSYRAQPSVGASVRLPDFTAGAAPVIDNPSSCAEAWMLRVRVCNRGAADTKVGARGAFYALDPRVMSSLPLCVTETREALPPGRCEVATCLWRRPMMKRADLWFRINDDGTGKMAAEECRTANNLTFLPDSLCVGVE